MSEQFNPGELFERLVGRAANAAGQLKVRSGLNPMLWLCAIISPGSFLAAWLMSGVPVLCYTLIGLGGLPIIFTCLGFAYFAIVKPHILRSEEYQIRHEALEIIKQKGSPIVVSPSSLEAIANPAYPRLSAEGD